MSTEKRIKGVGVKVLQVWSRLFIFDMEYRLCLIAKNFDRSSREVSCCGAASSCAGGLHPGCYTFTSFLVSMLHHGSEIEIAILE